MWRKKESSLDNNEVAIIQYLKLSCPLNKPENTITGLTNQKKIQWLPLLLSHPSINPPLSALSTQTDRNIIPTFQIPPFSSPSPLPLDTTHWQQICFISENVNFLSILIDN